MKKLLLSCMFIAAAMIADARPVKPGQWTTAQLKDGSTVRVELVGDEFMHYYRSADGTAYQYDTETGLFYKLDATTRATRSVAADNRRHAIRNLQRTIRQKRVHTRASEDSEEEEVNTFIGERHGLVILAEYKDVKFGSGHDNALFNDILNKENYTENGFSESARDYFRRQSGGKFDLKFDVVGPFTLANDRSYYSANSDAKAVEMITEGCKWAESQGVDFTKYDWDGDGKADQVFVVFAGPGYSADNKNCVWPYMSALSSDGYKNFKVGGVTIDTYACSCEMYNSTRISGIGSFCHEFSHCMGFPDMYDENGKWEGMGYYDLMDVGLYNNGEFSPADYSAYEKAECGWIDLQDMTDITTKTTVSDMQPMGDGGKAYVIYNKGLTDDDDNDECFIIEYRAPKGNDAYLPSNGVMITHIDYNYDIWDNLVQNTSNTSYWAWDYTNNKWVAAVTDHQRIQLVHADNSTSLSGTRPLYPATGNNSLSKDSKPAARLYNKNSDGSNMLDVAVNNIKIDIKGMTASMDFVPNGYVDPTDPDTPGTDTPVTGDAIFAETFDKCAGTGGNDDKWSTPNDYPTMTPDNEGWTATSGSYLRGGNKCLWFEGKKGTGGTLTSPEFEIDGTVTLQFKAGAMTGRTNGKELTLGLSGDGADGATLSNTAFAMEQGKWTTYTVTLTAHGKVALTLTNNKGSYMIDDVRVVKPQSTGVNNIGNNAAKTVTGVYTIDGIRLDKPRKGVNIVRMSDGTARKVIL